MSIKSIESSNESQPIQVPGSKSRRRSFLEYGGANSLNNFASSYSRAQQYAGSTLLESDQIEHTESLSPCLSPDEEMIIDNSVHDQRQESNEESTLIHHRRTSSILITGNSTVPQTIFNTINTLMGIGVLSLPFAFKLSGWVFGIALLIMSSLSTNITAKFLGSILQKNHNLMTYSDISYSYGGRLVQLLVTAFFISDLFGASLSLIILFSDSFSIIYENKIHLKVLITIGLFFLTLLPLNILSFLSLLGIISTVGIIILIFICGFDNLNQPGSLINYSKTQMFPSSIQNLLFSMGLYLVIYGGAPVFPELYRDMRHPKKFASCANSSFSIVTFLNFLIGSSGYLMFGDEVNDSIIKNLMSNSNYPDFINTVLFILMGMISISKLPLVVRPIITTYESLLKISKSESMVFLVISRVLFCGLLLTISLIFTSFGKLMSFLGSAICYTVCLTLPLLFYAKLNKFEIGKQNLRMMKVGIGLSIMCTVLGTYASISLQI